MDSERFRRFDLHANSTGNPRGRQVLAAAALAGAELSHDASFTMSSDWKTPEFLAKHPFGYLPALEDGELNISEVGAISEYGMYLATHSGVQNQVIVERSGVWDINLGGRGVGDRAFPELFERAKGNRVHWSGEDGQWPMACRVGVVLDRRTVGPRQDIWLQDSSRGSRSKRSGGRFSAPNTRAAQKQDSRYAAIIAHSSYPLSPLNPNPHTPSRMRPYFSYPCPNDNMSRIFPAGGTVISLIYLLLSHLSLLSLNRNMGPSNNTLSH